MNFGAGYVGSSADGLKIRRLEDQRKKQNEQAERVKAELAAESSKSRIVNFSAGNSEVIENAFKQESVGLQTKEQFVEKRANIERELEEERAKAEKAAAVADAKQKEKKRKKQKKELGAKLSFGDDEEFQDEDAEDEFVPAKKVGKVGKNPEVKTHFLPDRDREVAERDERERLKAQFLAEQGVIAGRDPDRRKRFDRRVDDQPNPGVDAVPLACEPESFDIVDPDGSEIEHPSTSGG